MKRFYCTICKRVKRVQKWPIIVENVAFTDPRDRVGQCNYHANPELATARKIVQMVHQVKTTITPVRTTNRPTNRKRA